MSVENASGISPQFRQQCETIVLDLGLGSTADIQSMAPLTGGVSSDIAVLVVNDRKFCVKCALDQLRVDAPWFAPVRRNLAEYRWIQFASGVVPQAVPALLGRSDQANGFAMEFIDPSTAWNYKNGLLAGAVDTGEAAAVGRVIGKIHAASVQATFDQTAFDNAADFHALRLEPYLAYTATKHPAVAAQLNQMVAEYDHARIALVHGDLSPKNVLIGPNGPILLDAECASFGDPAFDVAFFSNHFILKSFHLAESASNLMQALQQFSREYMAQVTWEPIGNIEKRACQLIPALMLGRIDGKSPAEYLVEPNCALIRAAALELLHNPPLTVSRLIERLSNKRQRS